MPYRLQRLIIVHGQQIVRDAGISAFGYPGMWATDNDEINKLIKQIEGR
jgi:hypothetical protein